MAGKAFRHLVLDSEAVSALLSAARHDARRATVVEAVAAANGRRVVPTAVRAEAGWDRTQPRSANANRLVSDDDPLDRRGADRAVALRTGVPAASVVDAATAVAAERVGSDGEVVEILTSDTPDLSALGARIAAPAEVRAL